MQQQINLDKNVTIEFTPQQLTTVISFLNKGAYEQVAGIIATIEKQVIEQLQKTKE